jgi:hypothetical protein
MVILSGNNFFFPVAVEIDQGEVKSKLRVMQNGSVLFR